MAAEHFATVALAAVAAMAVALIGPILISTAGREWRDAQERQAVRYAIAGRCEEGIVYAARAGHVPYDFQRLCARVMPEGIR